MDKSKYIFHTSKSFNNNTEGGIIKAREELNKLKETNKPFLEKHKEYKEDYSFDIQELNTKLEYFIYNSDLYDPEENQ